ncbi:MAG: Abi family protein [Treponema sp.]|nr:Abi family protein [Treponema sp.]
MMDKNTFDSLKKSISEERLAVYRADGVDDTTAIARYIYNIALCKSLYPLINIFEVTLRNSIDKALEKYFNQPDWNNVIHLNQTELMMINDAMLKIKRQGKKYSHGRLIAELTLGFWVALMGRKYNNQGFQFAVIKNCLHGCPSNQKSSGVIQKNLSEIRFLRNRIAHHERISHWKDLKQKHDLLLDFIKWLNPDMYTIASEKDTFNDIYTDGVKPFVAFVNEKL